jgi:aryl-alcohol dehydrogenase-like predicted oxidoreductase
MRYSEMGRTGIEVSKICLGTMTFGEQNTEAEGHEQIDYALSQGVNFIDTAEMYSVPGRKETQGSTETIIGNWLAKNKSERSKIVLASKVTGIIDYFRYISPILGFNRPRIIEAIDGSLDRLQTDYLDLYQFHFPERKTNFFGKLGYVEHDAEWEDNFEEAIATLKDLKQEGKIRHWGLSNETPWGVMRTYQVSDAMGMDRPQTMQNPYSLLNRTYEVGLSEISMREGLGLLAYSPLAFGRLTGKFDKGLDTPNDRINKFKNLARYNNELCLEATKHYLKIAEDAGMTLTEMALAFVNDRPFMCSNIIGATNMTQLKENIASIDTQLSADVLAQIEMIHNLIPNPAP